MIIYHSPAQYMAEDEETPLHLRMLNGTLHLYNADGIRIAGLTSIKVEQKMEDMTRVTVEMLVEYPEEVQ